jgi:putative ABC transport system substrate-binding protein
MNNRRRLVIALASAVSIPRDVFAQAKKPPVVIGWLTGGSESQRNVAAFKEEMATLGWREGASYILEARSADGRRERLPALAVELAARKPSVIVTALATAEAAKAAPNVPVVQALGESPVASGLAASLARPGGMVTGITNLPLELSEKYLELLLAAVPKLKRVGFLVDRKSPGYADHIRNARRAVEHYRVEAHFAEAGNVEELDHALELLKKFDVQGLVLPPSAGLFGAERQRIVKFALAQRWPVVAGPQVFADEGALLSYSADPLWRVRRAAHFVDRILKGAKPGELPIEQPMSFDLAVNMKTAKALGLTLPPEIMVRATRVIQ